MRCINSTCGRPLTRAEERAGHTRCDPCRGITSRTKASTSFNGPIAPKPQSPVSWWLSADRDHFTDLARARQLSTIGSYGHR